MFRNAQLKIVGVLIVACLGASLPQTSFAQQLSIKPGLWDIEQVFEMADVPQGGFKNHWQHCIKEEVAKRGPVFSDHGKAKGGSKTGECRIENITYPERGHIIYEIICGENGTHVKVDYHYTETSFEGTSQLVSEGRNVTYKVKGRYMGPCNK